MEHQESRRSPYIRAIAFIDWNSQLRIYGKSCRNDAVAKSELAFRMITRKIATQLTKNFPDQRFNVGLRLYHGWHKGFEPTANKKAILKVIAETDFATLSHRPSLIFSPEVEYGDCLLSALPERMHKRLRIHLPNTLQDKIGEEGFQEKMVDTALASDVVFSAFQDSDEWIIVVSEDDDCIPPLFVAESILKSRNSKALLLSSRKRANNTLNIDDLSLGA